METMTVQTRDAMQIERTTIAIYCVYSIGVTCLAMICGWPIWLAVWTDASWLIALLVHITRFRDYPFRAFLTASLIQVSLVMWSICSGSLTMTASLMAAMVLAVGLYGIPEIIYITVIGAVFTDFYHILIKQTVDFSSRDMIVQTIIEVVSVYFVSGVMYLLIRKRVENAERARRSMASIQRAEHSKDDFLANVSHEIRTPVNTICGMSEIVLRAELADDVRADIFSIQTAGRTLLSIVSDVLDFTELQSGKMALVEENYNITSTLNDIINMSMARMSEKQLELIVDCSADLPCSLFGDEQKIRRTIVNLVNNALKFTVEGYISISIYGRKTDYGINLIVCVKDTGIGIKEESREQLFNSFNQVDTRRNRQEGGIGLGLAVSQAMVDKLGGFITIESEFGRGSEFRFVVPQKVMDPMPIASVQNPARVNVAIYIDMERYDRPEVRKEYEQVIAHMIEQLKVKCHICRNLAELKRRAERETFSHIFISIEEYEEDTAYFDQLSQTVKVVAVIERVNEVRIRNPRIRRMYKPFFILPVVMILNNEKIVQGMDTDYYYHGKFIAPGVNVLVVDDNLMNIRVLEGLLAPYKLKVSMATSGAEALDKIDSMDYDTIFMDHMMPEMDGIETLHRIRQKQGNYFKKIPVIAVTANAVGGMREVFLNEGFQDFMAKPIEVSVLERILRRNLPQEKLVHVREEKEAEQVRSEIQRCTDLPEEWFDEQMGIRYCGGLEEYITILQANSSDGQEDKSKIQQYYDRKDWKNYTISVHALKSNMINIGVEKLSGMAKELELAGKRGDETYILKHHDAVIREYTRILELLEKSRTVHPGTVQETLEGLEALEEADLDRIALDFEDAAYAFDSGKMAEIAERLAGCSYHGHAVKAFMESIMRKIEMSDYLSASEAVARLKDKIG